MLLEMGSIALSSLLSPLTRSVVKAPRMPGSPQEEEGDVEGYVEASRFLEIKVPQHIDFAKIPASPTRDISDILNKLKEVPAGHSIRLDIGGGISAQDVTITRHTQKDDIIVSPTFKLIFLTVVVLTVASAIVATAIAFATNNSQPNQQAVFDSMNTAWQLGLGAIFGLLGGKAA
jgi:hypothetical protein